jgi:hypothetical protein
MLRILLLISIYTLAHAQPGLTITTGDADFGAENIAYGSARNYSLMQLKLTASSAEDIRLDQVVLRLYTDESNYNAFIPQDMRLYYDVNNDGILQEASDYLLGDANLSSWSGSYHTSTINAKEHNTMIIPAGNSRHILVSVRYQFHSSYSDRANNGDWYQIRFVSNSQISATGVESSASASISGAALNGGVKSIVSSGTTGSLSIAPGSDNPVSQNVAIGATDVSMLQLSLFASSAENINVTAITLTPGGSGNESTTIDSVRLFVDVDNNGILSNGDTQIGSTVSGLSDDENIVFDSFNETISKGNTEKWLLLYSFTDASGSGTTFSARLDAAAYVTATGASSSSPITPGIAGNKVEGGLMTLGGPGTLSFAIGDNTPPALRIPTDQDAVVMAQLSLSASSTETVQVSDFRFKSTGTGSTKDDVSQVYLYEDKDHNGELRLDVDELIASHSWSKAGINDSTFQFTGLSYYIGADSTANWLIVYDFNGNAANNETFYLKVDSTEWIAATGLTSMQSIAISGTPVVTNQMKITTAGALTVTPGEAGNANENIRYGASAYFPLIQVKLTASDAEDILLNTFNVRLFTRQDNYDAFIAQDMRLYYDENGDGVLQEEIDDLLGDANLPNWNGEYHNLTLNATEHNNLIIPAGATRYVILVGKFNWHSSYSQRANVNDWFQQKFLYNWQISGTGQSTQSAVSVAGAPFLGGLKKIVASGSPGSLTISAGGSNPVTRNVAVGQKDEGMFQVKLQAGSTEHIDISSITFKMNGSGDESSDLDSVRLYQDVDGDGLLDAGDIQIGSTLTGLSDNDSLVFGGINERIVWGNYETWLVVYDFADGQGEGDTYRVEFQGSANVTAVGATSGSNIAATVDNDLIIGSYATLSTTGSLALGLGDDNPVPQKITADASGQVMAQLELTTTSAEAVRINTLKFKSTGSGSAKEDLSRVRLFEDKDHNGQLNAAEDRLIATQSYSKAGSNDSTFTFSGLNEVIGVDSVSNWLVVYDFNGNASGGETFYVKFDSSSWVSATGESSSQAIEILGTPLIASQMQVTTAGLLTIEPGEAGNANENIRYGASAYFPLIQVKLTAADAEDILLNTFNVRLFTRQDNYDAFIAQDMRLYYDENGDGVLQEEIDDLLGDANLPNWNGEYHNLTLNATEHNNLIIPAGATRYVILVGKFNWHSSYSQRANVNDWFQQKFLYNWQISGTGQSTQSAVSVAGAPFLGGLKKIVASGSPGSLTISAGGSNPVTRNVAVGQKDEGMFQVKLQAGSTEHIDISSITFKMNGSGDESSDLDSVRLYQDVDGDGLLDAGDIQIGSTLTGLSDNDSLVFGGINERIVWGNYETWLVVYDFADGQGEGDTYRVEFQGSANVTAVGATSGSNIAATVDNDLIIGSYATLSTTGSLALGLGDDNPVPQKITADASGQVMAQLELTTTSAEAVRINTLKFKSTGSGSAKEDLSRVRLFEDKDHNGQLNAAEDRLIATQSYSKAGSNDSTFTFSGLNEVIGVDSVSNWLVVYDFNGNASGGETFYVKFDSSSWVSATGESSSQAIEILGTPLIASQMQVTTAGLLTIEPGEAGNANENIRYGASAYFPLIQVKLTAADAEDILLNTFNVRLFTRQDNYDAFIAQDMRLYYDENGDGVLQEEIDDLLGDANLPNWNGEYHNLTLNATEHNNLIIPAGATRYVILVGKFNWHSSYSQRANVNDWFQQKFLYNWQISGTGQSTQSAVSVAGAPFLGGLKKIVASGSPGSLTISAGGSNPVTRNVAVGQKDEGMFQVKLQAGSTEHIDISSITFKMNGSGDESSDLDSVRLYQDVDGDGLLDAGDIQIGSTLTGLSDNDSLVFGGINERIVWGNYETWLVVYDFADGQGEGDTYRVEFQGSANVTAVGATSGSNIAATVDNDLIIGSYATLSTTGSLALGLGDDNPVPQKITADASGQVMAQLELTTTSAEAVRINTLKFKSTGSGSAKEDLSRVRLFEDKDHNGQLNAAEDRLIATQSYSKAGSNDSTFTFSGLNEVIGVDSVSNWLVVYDFNGNASGGETFYVKFDSSSWVSATGESSSQAIEILGTPLIASQMQVTTAGLLTIEPGEAGNANENIRYGASAYFPLIQVKLTAADAEDILLNTFNVRLFTRQDNYDAFIAQDMRLYYDENGDGVLQEEIDDLLGDANLPNWNGEYHNLTLNATEHNNLIIPAGATRYVILVGKFNWHSSYSQRANVNDWFQQKFLYNWQISGTGQSTQSAVSVAGAPFLGGLKKIVASGSPGSLTISAGGSNPVTRNVAVGQKDEGMFQVKLQAGSTEHIDISSITFKMNGSGDESSDLDSVRLYQDVDGDGLLDAGDIQIGSTLTGLSDNDSLVFGGINERIVWGNYETWLVVYDFADGQGEGDTYRVEFQGSANVTAVGATSGSNIAATVDNDLIIGSYATLSNVGSLALGLGDDNPVPQKITADASGQVMAQLELTTTSAEAVRINTLKFKSTGSGSAKEDLSRVRLFEDKDHNGQLNAAEDRLIATQSYSKAGSNDSTFTFSGLNEVIGVDSVSNWLVVYDFNGNASGGETFYVKFDSSSWVSATGESSSQAIEILGTPLIASQMQVTTAGLLTIEPGEAGNANENIRYGASAYFPLIQVKLTAADAEDILLNTFNVRLFTRQDNYDAFIAQDMRLYYDENGDGVLQEEIDDLLGDANLPNWNGEYHNLTLNATEHNNLIIPAGATRYVILVGKFNWHSSYSQRANVNDWFQQKFLYNWQISGTGQSTQSAVSVAGAPFLGGLKKIVASGSPGSLTISAGGSNPVTRNVAVGQKDEGMFQVKLQAGSTEHIDISSITFKMNGSGDESSDLDSVRLYQDVDGDGLLDAGDIQIGSTLTGLSDNDSLVFGGINERIVWGNYETWLVVYDFADGQGEGDTYRVEFQGSANVTAVGATSGSNIAATVDNDLIIGSYATLSNVGSLDLSIGAKAPDARSIAADAIDQSMTQLALRASSAEAVIVESFKFKSTGTGSAKNDLSRVRLFEDSDNNGQLNTDEDRLIGILAYSKSPGDSLFTFNGLSERIPADSTVNWILIYDFNGNASGGETFYVKVDSTSWIKAVGENSTVDITTNGTPILTNTMTVTEAGLLTVSIGDADTGDANIAYGYGGIVELMQYKLTASNAEDILLNTVNVRLYTRQDNYDAFIAPDLVLYYDVNNDGVIGLATDILLADGNVPNWNGEYHNLTLTATEHNSLVIPAGNSRHIILGAKFNYHGSYSQRANTNDWFINKFNVNSQITGTGQTTLASVAKAGATLIGGTKRIVASGTAGDLSINAGINNTPYRFVSIGQSVEPMLQIAMAASAVEDVRVDSFYVHAIGTGDDAVKIDSVRLYQDVDGDGQLDPTDLQIGSTIYQGSLLDNDTLCFKNLAHVITKAQTQQWLVVYDLNTDATDNGKTFQVRLTGLPTACVTGVTSIEKIIPTLSADPLNGGRITVTDIGTIDMTLGDNSPAGGNIGNSDTDISMIQLNLSVSDVEPITVNNLSFLHQGSGNIATDVAAIELVLDNNNNGTYEAGTDAVIATINVQPTQSDTITFSGIDQDLARDTDYDWLVVYDYAGTAAVGKNYNLKIFNSGFISAVGDTSGFAVNVRATNGFPVTGSTYTVSSIGSVTFSIGENDKGATFEAASAHNLSMLQIKISASAVENININSITLTAAGSGHDLNDLNGSGNGVSLYLDNNSDGNIDAGDTQIDVLRTYSGNNGTLTFATAGQVINAGTTEYWLVVYDMDGSASVGETFRTGIYNGAVSATGATSLLSITPNGIPLTGSYKTIAATGSMAVSEGANNPIDGETDRASTLVSVIQFNVAASSVEAIVFNSLTLTHLGEGDPVGGLANNGVRLLLDKDNDGLYDASDSLMAQGTFIGNTLVFAAFADTINASSNKNYIITYDFNGTSAHNHTYEASIINTAHIGATGLTSTNPVNVSGDFAVTGGTQTVTAYAYISVAGLDFPNSRLPLFTDNMGIMELRLTCDRNIGGISSLRVDNRSSAGIVDAATIDSVKVFLESGLVAGYQPGSDILVGAAEVVDDGLGGYAIVSITHPFEVVTTGTSLYIAYDILNGTSANAVGVSISQANYLTPADAKSTINPASFPLSSGNDYTLPVELLGISVVGGKGTATLTWTTANEVNNLGFRVERKAKDDEAYALVADYRSAPELGSAGTDAVGSDYQYLDATVPVAGEYTYRLKQVDLDGTVSLIATDLVVMVAAPTPDTYELSQNYPNPFNPTTKIAFSLPNSEKVTIEIFNITGRLVKKLVDNRSYDAGHYTISWDATNQHNSSVATGMYYYVFKAGKFKAVRKMVFIK